MTRGLYNKVENADWHYLDDRMLAAVIAGANDAYFASSFTDIDSLDDMTQYSLLYVATHRETVESIKTPTMLRSHVKSRLIRDHTPRWDKGKETHHFMEWQEDME